MKKFLFITTFVVFIFIPISANADIIINEIAWMGTTTDYNDEWIELYSDEDIDLTNWTLEATDGSPSIALTGNISANGYFLLERSNDDSVPNIVADQIYTGALSNNGENLNLKNENGDMINNVVNCEEGWCAGDNLTKQTMQWVDSAWGTGDPTPKAVNSISETPTPSEEPSETPPIIAGNNPPIANAGDNIIGFISQEINFDGTKSSDSDGDELFYSWNMGDGKLIEKPIFTYKYLYPGTYLVSLMVYDGRNYTWDTITIKIQSQEITINEFIPNPEGKDEENEWIEIFNDSDSIVDISNWQLDDEASGSQPFIFPENSLIAPKSYVVFSRQITGIALNNDKDKVRLLLPEGIVFQEIDYENPKQGQSSARTDEGFVWSPPTPGMANIINPPQGIGGLENEKQIVYQGQVKSETTKQPSQDYSWYFQSDFDKEIEEEFKTEDQLAMIPSLDTKQNFSKKDFWNQNNLNLILMIIAVILAGSTIGLIIIRFTKKST